MQRLFIPFVVLMLLVGAAPIALAAQSARPAVEPLSAEQTFVVVYAAGVPLEQARAALATAGGTIVRENSAVGVTTVTTSNPGFVAAVRQQPALLGAAPSVAIGQAQQTQLDPVSVELRAQERQASQPRQGSTQPGAEPLADLQWNMRMIGATADGAHRLQTGDRRVLVGVIDTGIDASHPDLAPNFDHALSRNFTQDIPSIDGACADDPDSSCVDPADVDEFGHGTHVAGTIAAPINGIGLAGVAPNVTLVNLRAGQDSGYFLLQPVVDALTYAGDVGIDVVNMSFSIDPWLYNCSSNPADSPDAQLAQRTTIAATQRALDYAFKRNVTLVASEGNSYTDLGKPASDTISPALPLGSAYPRAVDNSCLLLPVEGDHVIGVAALGPSTRKAYYSDYGLEQTDLSAPGGDYYDSGAAAANMLLAPYPLALAKANGNLNDDGTPNTPFVVRDCQGETCGYYVYGQGASDAAPHVAGVAALIVSQYGHQDGQHPGGLTLNPVQTAKMLERSARDTACPEPRLFDYPAPIPARFNALCEGTPDRNGFYGEGIVDALNAVTGPRGSK